MKYGISVPNFGAYADLNVLAGYARRAEMAGFDGFFVWDHIHHTGWAPGGPPAPVAAADPTVALTAIALATSTIRFGPMVTPLPRRRPWKVARETVTLDHLSGGRLILGVGLGFPPDVEYEAFGEQGDWNHLARSLDEGLEILTRLWTGERISYEGVVHRVRDVQMLPRPVQQPRIPIWCAGMWPGNGPFRRAARWDGVFPIFSWGTQPTPDDVRSIAERIRGERGSLDGFDLVVPLTPEVARDSALEREFAAAGATWRMASPYTTDELKQLLG